MNGAKKTIVTDSATESSGFGWVRVHGFPAQSSFSNCMIIACYRKAGSHHTFT